MLPAARRRDWADAPWLPALLVGLRLVLVAGVAGSNWWLTGRVPTFVWPYDTASYLKPIEQLLATGTYTSDPAWLPAYAGRMPGLGAPYLLLRLAGLSPSGAGLGLIGVQVAGSCASLVWLGRLTRRLAPARVAAGVMLLAAVNPLSVVLDLRLMTESLSTTVLVLVVWRFVEWQRAGHLPALPAALGVGLLLAWLVFLRPYLVVLAGALPLLALAGWGGGASAGWPRQWRRRALVLAGLWLPLAVADGAWLARNWPLYHRLVPLQSDAWAGYRYSQPYVQLRDFCAAVGEEPVVWQPGSLMSWFAGSEVANPGFAWRSEVFAPSYNADSLRWLRHCYGRATDSAQQATPTGRKRAAAQVLAALRRYGAAQAAAHPLHRLANPLKMMYYLLLAHPTMMLFDQPYAGLPAGLKALKLLVAGAYLLGAAVGLLSLGWWPRRLRAPLLLVRTGPGWLLLLFCGLFPLPEPRYGALVYPFLLVSGGAMVGAGIGALRSRGRPASQLTT